MSTPAWRPVGSIRGPAGPAGPALVFLPFSMQGQVRVVSGLGRFPVVGGTYRVETVAATVEAAPLGSPIVVDVLVNGASIYAGHPERRPAIASGATLATVGAHNPITVSDGDYVNVNVAAVGSLLSGHYLVVAVGLQQITAVDETLT